MNSTISGSIFINSEDPTCPIYELKHTSVEFFINACIGIASSSGGKYWAWFWSFIRVSYEYDTSLTHEASTFHYAAMHDRRLTKLFLKDMWIRFF